MQTIKFYYPQILFIFLAFTICSCNNQADVKIDRDLKKWHRITLNFEGPETEELGEINPFLDYRLDVTFTNVHIMAV